MMTAKDPAAARAALMGAVKRNKTVHRLVPIVGVGEGQESRRTFAALSAPNISMCWPCRCCRGAAR